MPEPLKNIFTPQFFDELAFAFKKALPLYKHSSYCSKIFNNEWENFELKQRVRHAALCLHTFLPSSFPEASQQLVQASKLLRENRKKEYGFFCIFLCDYVEVYGLDHFKESMNAIEEITQLSSAEFCIRQFILKYPEKAMAQMLRWSTHPNEHVRRLASEGCRPRLPWAVALPAFKKDPSMVLPILENLKTDDSEYVRRSVANNLNDIAKDNPQTVIRLVAKWKGKNPYTDAILKHGCRTLLKKGDEEALRHLGFKSACKVKTENFKLGRKKIKLGEVLSFSFDFKMVEKSAHKLRLEYGIDYQKSNGKSARKVFKITEGTYEPNTVYHIERRQRFQDFTTRKHYPGIHHIAILINGKECCKEKFTLSVY